MTQHIGTPKAQSEMVALFVSDIHLQGQMPATTRAFLAFLTGPARHTEQLYLLGDLFEYWAGDDDIDAPFNRAIVDALRALSDAGIAVFWIAGNRDFLVGDGFAKATGATLLTDGTVMQLAGQRIVLAHGDAQCTDDIDYITFRNQVRQPAWQQQFLAMPLQRRKAIIDDLRKQSRVAQQGKQSEIMDVNPAAIAALFASSGTTQMIHGHTHRPATHTLQDVAGNVATRYVLPDWDCDTLPVRGGWLGLDHAGVICRYGLAYLHSD